MNLDLVFGDLTEQIIGAAIKVHRTLGPGLLESAYEACMARELDLRHIQFVRQMQVPLEYEGVLIECGYRLDLLIADTVIVRDQVRGKGARCVPRATDDVHALLEEARGGAAEL
jgi:hypothetical protein